MGQRKREGGAFSFASPRLEVFHDCRKLVLQHWGWT